MSPRSVLCLLVLLTGLVAPSPAVAAVSVEARYVTMSDGTRIAVDVWRPADLPAGARVPAITDMGRYRRALERPAGIENDSNFGLASAFADSGYAYVVADARGTGASFGTLTAELGAAMIRDYGELVDWVAGQPWSNGRVGATGVSYSGDTAIKLAALRRPALKAIAPLHYDFDPYEDLVFPGGLLIEPRLAAYAQTLRILDGVPGADCEFAAQIGVPCERVREEFGDVKPVDGPDGRALRSAAQAEHAGNLNLAEFAQRGPFRDDRIGAASWTVTSVASDRARIARSRVPIFTRAGWLDAGTVSGVLSAFVSLPNAQDSWIGPWNHGADHDADPFKPARAPVAPSGDRQFRQLVAFFDPYLKRGRAPRGNRRLHYYTLNEGRWRTTSSWPPRGTRYQRRHLAARHRLATGRRARGHDVLRVDPRAGTGAQDRWNTNLSGEDVILPDRRRVDRRLLTYTTTPLRRSVRITGLPRVRLLATMRRGSGRGGIHAYLEHVAPGGRVTYLTEGQLGLEHRRVASRRPLWRRLRTPRTYARPYARPATAGRRLDLRFELQPISVRFRRGDRIRLALAGANPDSFALLPQDRRAVYNIARASTITLPIAR